MVTPLETTAAKPKKSVDYSRIEPGWRAGILSPRQLAEIYTQETGDPLSHAAIIKHFAKAEIPRDLSAKIRAKAEEMVTREATKEVTRQVTQDRLVTTERDIVDTNAQLQADVIMESRRDIQKQIASNWSWIRDCQFLSKLIAGKRLPIR